MTDHLPRFRIVVRSDDPPPQDVIDRLEELLVRHIETWRQFGEDQSLRPATRARFSTLAAGVEPTAPAGEWKWRLSQ